MGSADSVTGTAVLQALETRLARHAVYQDGLAVLVRSLVCVGRINIATADTAGYDLWLVPHVSVQCNMMMMMMPHVARGELA